MMTTLSSALDIHLQLYPLQWGMKQEDNHPNHCPTSSNFCSPVLGIDIAIQPWMPNQHQGHLTADNCVAPTNCAGTYRPRNLTKMLWVSMWYSWLQFQEASSWLRQSVQAHWHAGSISELGTLSVYTRQGGEQWHRPGRTSSQRSKCLNHQIFCVGQ